MAGDRLVIRQIAPPDTLGGGRVLDPFAGSGTTLVQALESGLDATGVELAAFNCLLIGVKTARYDLDALAVDLREAYARFIRPAPDVDFREEFLTG